MDKAECCSTQAGNKCNCTKKTTVSKTQCDNCNAQCTACNVEVNCTCPTGCSCNECKNLADCACEAACECVECLKHERQENQRGPEPPRFVDTSASA